LWFTARLRPRWCRGCMRRVGEEPSLGGWLLLEELQEHPRDLFAAGVAGVGAVGAEVFAFPEQVAGVAAFDAVGPEVGAPEDDGRLDGAFGGVRVEFGVAIDL